MRTIHPVILCGGSGTRLWPLSRALLPKQFLPLAGTRSMLQETALRLAGLRDATAPILISHVDHRFLVAEQLREAGGALALHLLEPEGRNTAPAVAVAALWTKALHGEEATMLVMAADHLVLNTPAFEQAAQRAEEAARRGRPPPRCARCQPGVA